MELGALFGNLGFSNSARLPKCHTLNPIIKTIVLVPLGVRRWLLHQTRWLGRGVGACKPLAGHRIRGEHGAERVGAEGVVARLQECPSVRLGSRRAWPPWGKGGLGAGLGRAGAAPPAARAAHWSRAW